MVERIIGEKDSSLFLKISFFTNKSGSKNLMRINDVHIELKIVRRGFIKAQFSGIKTEMPKPPLVPFSFNFNY